MQYLLHDLLKLSLSDRLAIIEYAICSLENTPESAILKEKFTSTVDHKFNNTNTGRQKRDKNDLH